ncbi:MAG: thermonuclease family protein [Gammaproteobacteria bacterium]|uniref:thermonuclease family protein n=1 Tax=Rhodoferax sp. TaxID=50421 RepID=UPI0017AD3B44|nr:thermonuclease family protein [Rhodoferax sp.]MBU3897689.1 thermonuclease family protein [Gammaproteobacteria bacterium]MBU3978293.1 thermonuclease family protein [Patescibacteria group bacterium]MBA3056329.1 nuclease [Rhodoferax sp.]MBU4080065.1 thermonuclease family protein [Gammaproteobacteria bacterium]MBU4112184.1 thermonuclease family protein [Gammaproteobacteria bacterium]
MKIFGFALALVVAFCPAGAEVLSGRVVGISDGDTITVLDDAKVQHKIRVAGVDAPEKKQAFGQVSKENLSRLVFDKEVDIEWTKRDRYKRIVGKVLVASPCCSSACSRTFDAGLSQVSAGLAWWYRKYAKEQSADDLPKYEKAELGAQSRRQGLWGDKSPIAPWDWRKGDHGE